MSWESTRDTWVKKIEEARASLESVASAIHASAPFKVVDDAPLHEYINGLKWLDSNYDDTAGWIPSSEVPDRLKQLIDGAGGSFKLGAYEYKITKKGNAIKVKRS